MDTPPQVVNLEPAPAIGIRDTLSLAELPRFFGTAFGELAACAADKAAGPPLALYHGFTPDRIDVEAVLPVRAPVAPTGRVHACALDGGPAVQVRHVGTYADLGAAYSSIEQWLERHGRHRAGVIREIYLTPPTVPPTEQVTLVIQPLEPSRA